MVGPVWRGQNSNPKKVSSTKNEKNYYIGKIYKRIAECNRRVSEKKKEKIERGENLDWEEEIVIFGNDVVALFPSMTSANTGRIIRRQISKSGMKIDGIDYKHVLLYIMLNKNMTGDLGSLVRLLPWRRGVTGTAPGMKNKNLNSKNYDDILKTWEFPDRYPTDGEKRELLARMGEIGLRAIFENFMYTFTGKNYLQMSGGPIGARVTMAAARLVMQDWSEQYKIILTKAQLEIWLFNGYVDDGRQGTGKLEMGMRFIEKEMEFKFRDEWRQEDEERREAGESTVKRMSKQCQLAMNAINPDLDFSIWMEKNRILHSYFEKEMKTPLVPMQRTAMGEQQKYSILSNELIRRLSNISQDLPEDIERKEKIWVIDTMTKQLKNSGYSRMESAEAVVSGVRGFERKCERRKKEDGSTFYRHGRDTLKKRVRKKLTEKTSWYKEKKREDEEKDQKKDEWRVRLGGVKKEKRGEKGGEIKRKIKAVLFVPYTKGSRLAKELRENEEIMEKLTGYRLKIVERSGMKLENVLHKSNPWAGEDCERVGCLLCHTKKVTGKNMNQSCSKIIYLPNLV